MQRWIGAGALLGGSYGLVRLLRRRAPLPLAGKVVIVTGASSGIGRAAAAAFARHGAKVVLVARRAALLGELQQQLAGIYAAETLVAPADVSDDAALQTLLAQVQRAFGRVDVLVNNAGLDLGGPLVGHDPVRLRRLVEVNVYGVLRLTQLVLPLMLAQGSGHIVNISSLTGRLPPPGMAAYSATRAAVAHFSDALRRELDGTGIAVSLVLPAWTRTPMVPAATYGVVEKLWGPMDDPGVPAAAIVDAVRYRRREVWLGGWLYKAGGLFERIAPSLVDLWWRMFALNPDYLEAMRHLGE